MDQLSPCHPNLYWARSWRRNHDHDEQLRRSFHVQCRKDGTHYGPSWSIPILCNQAGRDPNIQIRKYNLFTRVKLFTASRESRQGNASTRRLAIFQHRTSRLHCIPIQFASGCIELWEVVCGWIENEPGSDRDSVQLDSDHIQC